MRRLPLGIVVMGAGLLLLGGCASRTGAALAPGQVFPVFFSNAAVVPDDAGRGVVNAASAWARKYPSESVQVTGYADPRAKEPTAGQLATRRADEIAALLEQKGVDPIRIRRSTGDEALIGYTGLGNRRVDISVGM